MAGKKKTVLKGFDYLHCDDFAAFLEEMAAKGWHFREWGAGLVFEQGEPRRDRYAVEVFSEASEYDTRPEVNTREFAEYCEAAGWTLVDAKRKFCIFRRVREDAVDILTQEERLQNISREERKEIWRHMGLAAMLSASRALQYTSYTSFVNIIFSNDSLLADAMWFVLLLAAVVRCIHFYSWKHRTEKRIAQGQAVYWGKSKNLFSFLGGWYGWISGSFIAAFLVILLMRGEYFTLLYMGGTIGALVLMAYLIAKFRPDAVTNQVIQTVFPLLIFLMVLTISLGVMFTREEEPVLPEDIPLLYSDIGGEAGELEEVTLDGSESIFGSALRCWLYYEDAHIYYQVYETEHRWILDKMWEEEMDRKYNQNGTDCTALWEAEAAVRTGPGYYRVRYDDAMLYLNLPEDVELTKSQADTIRFALYESR